MCEIVRLTIILLAVESNIANFKMFAEAQSTMAKVFVSNELVPDVLSTAPAGTLQVKYPSGVSVSEGNVLTPTLVKDEPQVIWDASPGAFYSLIFVDVDAPIRSAPIMRNALLWLVGNIQGGDVTTGEKLAAYLPSCPPPNTGIHRFAFVLYKQPGKIQFDEIPIPNTLEEPRRHFSITNFASKYNMGEPLFGNFFHGEYDDYVPTVYKQVGYA